MREKSLLRQWLELQHERAQTRKALNLLVKQEWSVEFLTALLVRASKVRNQQLEMTIRSPSGTAVTIRTTDELATPYKDASIFDHLDDELKVREFINQVSRAGLNKRN